MLVYHEGDMKKTNLLVSILVPFFALAVSSCSFLPGVSSTPGGSTSKAGDSSGSAPYVPTYRDNFVDTEGVKHYVALSQKDVYLLPGMSAQIVFDSYKEGESATFPTDRTMSSLSFWSDDPSIATIANKDDGVAATITAAKVGETRVHATIFESKSVGTNAMVHVLQKELTGISLRNVKTTYLLGSEFKPSFKVIGTFNERVEQEIPLDAVTVDSSKVNMEAEGTYKVTVTATVDGVAKTAEYEVKVIDNPTYEPRAFEYTIDDLGNRTKGEFYCPKQGDVKTLVIPVWFKDSGNYFTPEQKAKIPADLEESFYGEGNEETHWNSVSSFYKKASSGKLNLSGIVSPWYESGLKVTDFADDDGAKIKNLLNDSVDWFFENHPDLDPNDFDSDSNGYFDGINLIYAVNDAGEEHPEIPDTFWGKISFGYHRAPTPEMPGIHFHMWASCESLYEDAESNPVDSHVFTHEFGHTLGLEDYYDYGENNYYPVGGHIMMFHNTGAQDPFSTSILGYSKVIVPETSCTIELGDFQNSRTAVLLSPSPSAVNTPFDEYLLVELYAPNGLNQFDAEHPWRGYYSTGAENPGIRVWHVDARLAYEVGDDFALTSDPLQPGSFVAFTNSWGDNHGTKLGREYDDNCLLFQIRNDKELTFRPKSTDQNVMMRDETLFHGGDTFTMEDYSKQFAKGGKLNSGEDLGWEFSIEAIEESDGGYTATLNFVYEG